MKHAIINGKVVTETEIIKADIVYDETGKIIDIRKAEENRSRVYESTIDADGCYVIPGGVDGHVHLGGFGEVPIADDFYTGSKAALMGGTTSVVDFIEPAPGQDAVSAILQRKQDAKDAGIDYGFHFTFTENYRNELKDLDKILEEGIGAFKAYTYYDYTSLKLGDFRTIMEHIKDVGPLLIHAEEKSIIDCMKEKMQDCKDDMLSLSLTRPNISEEISVRGLLALAKESGATICIAHTSTRESMKIKDSERGNQQFWMETCPHYLHFTKEKLKGKDGALYTMNPPLRDKEDNEALWKEILAGNIEIFSTDHCPYLKKYKYNTDYITVPCGVDGIQSRVNFLFSEGVVKRHLSIQKFVEMVSTNPAKLYHLYPQKGCIRVGSDADLVILDPKKKWFYGIDKVAGATDYTIFEGLEMTGKIRNVIKNGNVVVKNEKVTFDKGSGKFLNTVF